MPSIDDSKRYKGYVVLTVAVDTKSGAIADLLELRQALSMLLGLAACNTGKDRIRATVAQAIKRAGW